MVLTNFILVPDGTTVEILGTNSIKDGVGIQSTSNGDITVTGNILISRAADVQTKSQIQTTWGDIVVQDTAKVSVGTTEIAICGSYGDKIEITDQAQVTAISSSGICKFNGNLLVGKDAALNATSPELGSATINIWVTATLTKATDKQ